MNTHQAPVSESGLALKRRSQEETKMYAGAPPAIFKESFAVDCMYSSKRVYPRPSQMWLGKNCL